MLNDANLACRESLGVKLQNAGPSAILGNRDVAMSSRRPTQSASKTSSAGSSGCSRGDRFLRHLKKCHCRESLPIYPSRIGKATDLGKGTFPKTNMLQGGVRAEAGFISRNNVQFV